MSMPTLPPVTSSAKHTRVGTVEAPVADAFAALLAGAAAPVGLPIVAPAPVPAVTADDESTVAPVDAPAALQGVAAFVVPMTLTPVTPSSTDQLPGSATSEATPVPPVATGGDGLAVTTAVVATTAPATTAPAAATAAVDGAAAVEASAPTATTTDVEAMIPAATATTATAATAAGTPPVAAKVLPATASAVAVARVAETPASTHAAKHVALPTQAQAAHEVLHRGLAVGKNRLPHDDVLQPAPVQGLATATVQLSQGESPVQAADGPTAAVQPALVEAATHLKTEGGKTSLIIRLDPPELGAVLVRLTVKDGQVDVHMRTPDLTAQGDLRAQQLDVQQVLREQGLDLTGFHVSHGEAFTPNEGRQTPDRATPRRTGRADGHASTAHVMDDVTRPQPAGTWL